MKKILIIFGQLNGEKISRFVNRRKLELILTGVVQRFGCRLVHAFRLCFTLSIYLRFTVVDAFTRTHRRMRTRDGEWVIRYGIIELNENGQTDKTESFVRMCGRTMAIGWFEQQQNCLRNARQEIEHKTIRAHTQWKMANGCFDATVNRMLMNSFQHFEIRDYFPSIIISVYFLFSSFNLAGSDVQKWNESGFKSNVFNLQQAVLFDFFFCFIFWLSFAFCVLIINEWTLHYRFPRIISICSSNVQRGTCKQNYSTNKIVDQNGRKKIRAMPHPSSRITEAQNSICCLFV